VRIDNIKSSCVRNNTSQLHNFVHDTFNYVNTKTKFKAGPSDATRVFFVSYLLRKLKFSHDDNDNNNNKRKKISWKIPNKRVKKFGFLRDV